jgi:TPR repeat protein
MYRFLAFALLTLLIFASCAAAPLEDGRKAYERGDYSPAFRRVKPFAEQGDAKAQFKLGLLYYNGQGVPQDYSEAAKWWRKAAGQGIPKAQYNLGLMYAKGQGVPQDYSEAAKWYRKAAEGNVTQARLSLGMMHYKGEGVPKDYVLAYMWFGLAASGSQASEANFRELAVKGRDLLAPMMTPAQIAKAEQLAREWKPKAEKEKPPR